MTLKAMAHTCPSFPHSIEFDDEFESIHEKIEEIAFKVSIVGYAWQNHGFLNHQFVFTEDGRCHTFNALNSRDSYTDE